MEALNFNLQIGVFTTNTDEWENQDAFYCVFNEGHFREQSSGNCYTWDNQDYHYIGKIQKNEYNSYDLVRMDNKSYWTLEEALKALSELHNC